MQKSTAIKTDFTELKFLDKVLHDNNEDMSLIKAHGFLTALASFPTQHQPHEWLPILAGNLQANNGATKRTTHKALLSLYQQIKVSLYSDQEFKFLLSLEYPNLELRQVRYSNVQEWCRGYCLALVWQDQQWLYKEQEYITNACATFFVIADLLGSNEISNQDLLVNSLPEIVKSLFVYWHGSDYVGMPTNNIKELH